MRIDFKMRTRRLIAHDRHLMPGRHWMIWRKWEARDNAITIPRDGLCNVRDREHAVTL